MHNTINTLHYNVVSNDRYFVHLIFSLFLFVFSTLIGVNLMVVFIQSFRVSRNTRSICGTICGINLRNILTYRRTFQNSQNYNACGYNSLSLLLSWRSVYLSNTCLKSLFSTCFCNKIKVKVFLSLQKMYYKMKR